MYAIYIERIDAANRLRQNILHEAGKIIFFSSTKEAEQYITGIHKEYFTCIQIVELVQIKVIK